MNKSFTKIRLIKSVSTVLVVAAALFLLTWSGKYLLIMNDLPQKADAILVLGYPAEEDGSPSLIMKKRVAKGVELFRAGYAPRIIFSGGAVQNKFSEAEVMAEYAKSFGLPADAVILEKRARNTGGNTWYSWLIMSSNGWSKALVVTTPYHTKRVANFFPSILSIYVLFQQSCHPTMHGFIRFIELCMSMPH